MANLYEVLADSQQGQAMAGLSRQFGLTTQQAEAAVAALLPAIAMGLKQSTATPEGLSNLFAMMARQPDLYAVYDDPRVAFSPAGRAAGDAVLSTIFRSPEASRAIADQAQQLSGVTSAILKKLLPVLAGLLISGLMRSGSGQAAPSAPQSLPEQGGGLIDILRQIFGQGMPDSTDATPSRVPSAPPTSPSDGGGLGGKIGPGPGYQIPAGGGQRNPIPTGTDGQAVPGGDVLGQILSELGKAISEGRLKPVVLGPYEINIPGQSVPGGSGPSQQAPGGDVLGQILRDILSGGGQVQVPKHALIDGAGAAVFGDRLDTGQDVEQSHLDNLQQVLDRFLGAPQR